MGRRAIISPYEVGAVLAHSYVLNAAEGFSALPRLDGSALFFRNVVQSGLTKLVLIAPNPRVIPSEPEIKKRLLIRKGDEWVRLVATIEQAFVDRVGAEWWKSREAAGAHNVGYFMVSALYALAHGEHIVRWTTMADPGKALRGVPSDLRLPIEKFLGAFRTRKGDVVSLSVGRMEVELLGEALASAAYSAYVRAHGDLEDAGARPAGALRRMREARGVLLRRTHGVLSAKKVAIQLLNVTPVLVEKCLGRLPGHIAEVASSCAQKWLKEGRRLVVYDESATVRRVLEQRREELAVAYERGRA